MRGISGAEVSVSQSAATAQLKHTKRPAGLRKWSLETSSSALHHGPDRPLNGGGAHRDRVAEKKKKRKKKEHGHENKTAHTSTPRLLLSVQPCRVPFGLAAVQRDTDLCFFISFFSRLPLMVQLESRHPHK